MLTFYNCDLQLLPEQICLADPSDIRTAHGINRFWTKGIILLVWHLFWARQAPN